MVLLCLRLLLLWPLGCCNRRNRGDIPSNGPGPWTPASSRSSTCWNFSLSGCLSRTLPLPLCRTLRSRGARLANLRADAVCAACISAEFGYRQVFLANHALAYGSGRVGIPASPFLPLGRGGLGVLGSSLSTALVLQLLSCLLSAGYGRHFRTLSINLEGFVLLECCI